MYFAIVTCINQFKVYQVLNMSASNYVTSVAIFNGAQGQFYMVNGTKYHTRFPVEWAIDHKTISEGNYDVGSGPIECGNCEAYGSIRGVFVGYCSNCLRNYQAINDWRGNLQFPGASIEMLGTLNIWNQYPYMFGIQKEDIGDEGPNANLEINIVSDDEDSIEPYHNHNEHEDDSESDLDDNICGRWNY